MTSSFTERWFSSAGRPDSGPEYSRLGPGRLSPAPGFVRGGGGGGERQRCFVGTDAPAVQFSLRTSAVRVQELTRHADILAFLPQKQDFWRRNWLRGKPQAPCKHSDDSNRRQIRDSARRQRFYICSVMSSGMLVLSDLFDQSTTGCFCEAPR